VTARFVLKQGSTGKYHCNLVATNGQVIASGARAWAMVAVARGRAWRRSTSCRAAIAAQSLGIPPPMKRCSNSWGSRPKRCNRSAC
jgi:hypothetical protein